MAEVTADPLIEILKVSIPVAIAGIASFFSVHLWTMKKEKFDLRTKKYELRLNIQNDFQKPFVAIFNLEVDFYNEIRDKYVVNWELEDEEKKNITYLLEFPEDKQDLPSIVFAERFKKFLSQRTKFMEEGNKLLSTMLVYYDSKKLNKAYSDMINVESFNYKLFHLLLSLDTNENCKKIYDVLGRNLTSFSKNIANVGELFAITSLQKLPD